MWVGRRKGSNKSQIWFAGYLLAALRCVKYDDWKCRAEMGEGLFTSKRAVITSVVLKWAVSLVPRKTSVSSRKEWRLPDGAAMVVLMTRRRVSVRRRFWMKGEVSLGKYMFVTGLKLYPVDLYVFADFLLRSFFADEMYVDCVFVGFSI